MTVKISAHTPTSASRLSTSFQPQLEWSQKLSEVPAKYCSELLSFSAKRLQAQAEFLQGLADCHDVSDLLKRQSDFIQESWDAYAKELPRVLELPKTLGITGRGAD